MESALDEFETSLTAHPAIEAGLPPGVAGVTGALRKDAQKQRVLVAIGENLGNLLRQVSKTSLSEIDNLISELQTLRRKLQTDGDRIERDIAKHAELSQQVIQLTTIISDSVKKLPGRA